MLRILLLTLYLFVPYTLQAGEREDFRNLLNSNKQVKGVVFEIVGGDAASLRKSLVRIKSYVYQLRGKYDNINIVILSHGLEEFALLKRAAVENHKLHQQVAKLVNNHKVPVLVDSRFAGMNNVQDKEFIDMVEVIDSAPVQLENYRLKGYQIVLMDFPRQ